MPLPISIETLLKLNRVENSRVEFKESWNHATKGSIIRTICAFANDLDDLGGGYIVIGIAEERGVWKTPIKGIKEEDLDTIQKEILNACQLITPVYIPRMAVETVQGVKVLTIWVPSGEERPYRVFQNVSSPKAERGEKRYYVRYANVTKEPSEKDLRELLAMRNRVPFDEMGNPEIKMEDISLALIRDYLAKVKSKLADSDLRVNEVLENMMLLTGPSENRLIKNVAAMMFCEHPDKFFPHTRAEIVIFPEGRVENPGKFEELSRITGCVPSIINKVLDYLKTHVIKETIIKPKDRAESIRYYNYPYQALEEAVVNAFYHRDYQVPEPVEIVIEPRRISILSHSGPDRSIPDHELKEASIIRARKYKNRRLGDFLKELGMTEGRASGIPTIQSELEMNGSARASISTDEGRSFFLMDIPCRMERGATYAVINERSMNILASFFQRAVRMGKYTGKMPNNESMRLMLRVLCIAEGALSLTAIMEQLGSGNRETIRRAIINPLLEVGLLERSLPSSPNSSKQTYISAPSAAFFMNQS